MRSELTVAIAPGPAGFVAINGNDIRNDHCVTMLKELIAVAKAGKPIEITLSIVCDEYTQFILVQKQNQKT